MSYTPTTPVPDISNFNLHNVVNAINSESTYSVLSLGNAFKYSKSPQFDPTRGSNIGINKMSEFRNYKSFDPSYRVPGSEIAGNNPISLFPNNNPGYANASSLSGIVDAQYDSIGQWLYAIDSTHLYAFYCSNIAEGSSTNLQWNMTIIYTLPSGDTFSTKIQEFTDNAVFIGTTQGRLIQAQGGSYYGFGTTGFSGESIVQLDTSYNTTGVYLVLWALCSSGNVYYSIDYGVTFSSYNVGISGGAGHYTDFFCAQGMGGSSNDWASLIVRCNGTLTHTNKDSSDFHNWSMPGSFQNKYVHVRSDNTTYVGKQDVSFSPGTFLSLYNYNDGRVKGVMQLSVTGLILLDDSEYLNPSTGTYGSVHLYNGLVLINAYWRTDDPRGFTTPGFGLFALNTNGSPILKNTGLFTLFSDGSLGYGDKSTYSGETTSDGYTITFYQMNPGIINPHLSSSYFAANLCNNSLSLPAISLTNSAQSATISLTSNYAHYRLLIDADGSWLTINNNSWFRNGKSLTYTVTANATGKERFTWIHMLNADNNIIVKSFPVIQSA